MAFLLDGLRPFCRWSGGTAFGWRHVAFLLLITANHSLAQDDPVSFQRYDPREIPCPTQVDLVQCRYGFIWIVNLGLWRFDGLTFESISPDPSGATIPRSWIWHSMIGGRHGVLGLYGRANEFVLYDIAINRATVLALPASESRIHTANMMSCATEDSKGRFLIGTEQGDAYRLEIRTLSFEKIFPTDSRIPEGTRGAITDIVEDSSGTLWIGTSSGVLRLTADTTKSKEDTTGSSPLQRVTAEDVSGLALATDGRIWVLGARGELGLIDPRTATFTACAPAVRNQSLQLRRPICVDREGDVWVPQGHLGGIMRWDSRKERWYSYLMRDRGPDLIGGVHTTAAILDNSGNVWVGTSGEGLFRFTRSASRFLSCTPESGTPSGLSSSNVISAWKDREGVLWVGTTTDGLNYLPPGSRRFLPLRHNPHDPSSLPGNWVNCIRDIDPDRVWIGMVGGGGISVYDKRTGVFSRPSERSKTPRSLGSDTVTALHQDRSGRMWVGHFGGLDRYDAEEGTFRSIIRWSRETLGGMGSVAQMTEDGAGNLWLATAGRGLGRLNMRTDEVTWFRNDPNDPGSLPTNSVWCLYFDETRRALWVPGRGDAIARYSEATNSFVSYRLSPAPPVSFPFESKIPTMFTASPTNGIVADSGGNLWVAAGANIIKFNPDDGTHRMYGPSQGIVVVEARRNAFLKTDDGTIYIGGSGGLTWFHPGKMPENKTIPRVILARFAIFGEPVQLPPVGIPEISLSHREHTFSFEFAALEYTNPTQNQYMYKLEGAGGDWVYLGTDRRVTFANVSPGEYLLRVRASNNDGVWNYEGISIPVVITPPYWETFWFRATALLLVAGVVAGVARYRQLKMRGVEELRFRIANDLHDDIGSELSAIALESDLIARRLNTLPEQRRRVHEVGRAVRSAAEQLRDVVWIVNPEQEKLGDLVGRMKEVARTLLAGLEVSLSVRWTPRAVSVAMEFKRNVLLMYKEILNNIVRHAHASKATILIEVKDGLIHVCVTDNGTGFDSKAPTTGRGLKSIRARAEHIGGTLTVESTPGAGTNVCFRGRIIHL